MGERGWLGRQGEGRMAHRSCSPPPSLRPDPSRDWGDTPRAEIPGGGQGTGSGGRRGGGRGEDPNGYSLQTLAFLRKTNGLFPAFAGAADKYLKLKGCEAGRGASRGAARGAGGGESEPPGS